LRAVNISCILISQSVNQSTFVKRHKSWANRRRITSKWSELCDDPVPQIQLWCWQCAPYKCLYYYYY